MRMRGWIMGICLLINVITMGKTQQHINLSIKLQRELGGSPATVVNLRLYAKENSLQDVKQNCFFTNEIISPSNSYLRVTSICGYVV